MLALEDPAWWETSAFAAEILALGPAGRRFMAELERLCGAEDMQGYLMLALTTARLVDRMRRIEARLAEDHLMPGGKPHRLLAELARCEKIYLMNIRSLGLCDKEQPPKKVTF